jgi:hypothetical protein
MRKRFLIIVSVAGSLFAETTAQAEDRRQRNHLGARSKAADRTARVCAICRRRPLDSLRDRRTTCQSQQTSKRRPGHGRREVLRGILHCAFAAPSRATHPALSPLPHQLFATRRVRQPSRPSIWKLLSSVKNEARLASIKITPRICC